MPENLLYSPSLGQDDYPERLKQLRAMVDPAPGWDYGNILPMAWNQQGEVRPAVPQAARQALQGYIDLLASPYTGGITAPAFEAMAGTAMAPPGAGEAAMRPGVADVPRSMPPLKDPWASPSVDPAGILAYHGSPAKFDQFSNEFIGSGEGAQAYGYGHYAAGAEPVAEGYRKKLAGAGKVKLGDIEYLPFNTRDYYGRPYPEGSPPGKEHLQETLVTEHGVNPTDAMTIANEIQDKGGDLNRALPYLKQVFSNIDNSNDQSAAYKVLNLLEHRRAGHTYELGIKGDPEQHFIDWEHLGPDLQREAKSPQGAKKLQEAGFAGIKYLDRMSRGKGEGSYNYVVFDPANISILRRYGLSGIGPGSMIPGALSQPQAPPQVPNALLPQIMGNQS